MIRFNKYPGSCHRCGTQHAAGAALLLQTSDGWRVQCQTPCEIKAAPVPQKRAAVVGDLANILALFAKAKTHLKFPAIVFGVPKLGADGEWVREPDKNGNLVLVWSDLSLRVHIAGERAKEPGSLTVVNAERDADGGREWFGRILLDGIFHPSNLGGAPAIAKRLREFAADPARVAGEDGRLLGRCCFCRLPLSDERSTAVGYGSVCASNFGLHYPSKGEAHAHNDLWLSRSTAA
jgi:hypothetical protein